MTLFTWRDKRRIWFVKEISGVYSVISKRKIKSGSIVKTISLRKNTFSFDIGLPVVRFRNIFFYFVDVDKGQITLKNPETIVTAELMDVTFKRNIAKQIVTGLESSFQFSNLVLILMGITLGALAGYIIGNFIPFS
ncbi:MAG: hypothetical protein A2V66_16345 [Ignavibacteria bacterium RBG_13_36_8]|nr:MAG: hypothetical protein A2V66_16345 [Ignavibacteria bacterium RBG_13_36_8]